MPSRSPNTKLKLFLLPKDEADRKNAIIDVFNEGILIQATSKSVPWGND